MIMAQPEARAFSRPEPMGLLLNTPARAQARVASSRLIEALSDRLRDRANLKVELIEPREVRDCAGALPCVQKRMYSRIPSARYHLIVSNFSSPDGADSLSMLFLDRTRLKGCKMDTPGCASKAIFAQSGRTRIKDLQGLEAHLDAFFREKLQPVLEDRWNQLGQIVLELDLREATVSLDGRALGKTQGNLRITKVPTGQHTLQIRAPAVNLTRVLQVAPKKPVYIRLGFPLNSTAELTTFYTGLGVAALGLGITAWSAAYAAQNRGLLQYCEPSCDTPRLWTLEQQASGTPQLGVEGFNEGRVLALPLGYSLALAGGLLAAWTALFVERDEDLWLPAVLGVALGGLAYGLSAVAY